MKQAFYDALAWLGHQMLEWFGPLCAVLFAVCNFLVATASVVMAGFAILDSLLDVPAALNNMAAVIRDFKAVMAAQPTMAILDQLNRLVPLNEFMVMMGMLFGLQLLALFVRFIFKVASHVPLIGGK